MCETCVEANSNNCLLCVNKAKLQHQGSCVDVCPDYFFAESRICAREFCVATMRSLSHNMQDLHELDRNNVHLLQAEAVPSQGPVLAHLSPEDVSQCGPLRGLRHALRGLFD